MGKESRGDHGVQGKRSPSQGLRCPSPANKRHLKGHHHPHMPSTCPTSLMVIIHSLRSFYFEDKQQYPQTLKSWALIHTHYLWYFPLTHDLPTFHHNRKGTGLAPSALHRATRLELCNLLGGHKPIHVSGIYTFFFLDFDCSLELLLLKVCPSCTNSQRGWQRFAVTYSTFAEK